MDAFILTAAQFDDLDHYLIIFDSIILAVMLLGGIWWRFKP